MMMITRVFVSDMEISVFPKSSPVVNHPPPAKPIEA
jgi:hypothetical protein